MTRKVFVVELTEEMASKVAATRPPAVKRGAQFSAAWTMGKALAGYNEDSPIWGKSRSEVFEMIEERYAGIAEALKKGDTTTSSKLEGEIALFKNELEKRKAARGIAWAARASKK